MNSQYLFTFYHMICVISNELAEFFNNGSKTTMSRVEITRRIDKYIEEHGLRFYTNINPDEKLKNLLKCGDSIVTFANLQSYIAPHIVLPPPPSAPPLSPESVYAVLPEDEFPEPPIPQSPSIYAVFPEDEIIPQVVELAKAKAEAQKAKAEAQKARAKAEAEAKTKAERNCFNCGKPGHGKINCPSLALPLNDFD
jgi:hypothetical protein